MKPYHKRKFVTAVIAAAVSIGCLAAYFATGREPRFIIAFFLALAFTGLEGFGAFSKRAGEWKLDADERDLLIAMKASQTALRILNRLLLTACIASGIFYAIFRSPFCMALTVTFCIISIALFAIVLITNLYYERHG